MKVRRFITILVGLHADSGNRFGTSPQVRVQPVSSASFRSKENNVGLHAVLTVRHQHGELPDARLRAGAVWVRKHNERRLTLRVRDLALHRPMIRNNCFLAGGVFVNP